MNFRLLGEKCALLSDGSVRFEGRDFEGHQIRYDKHEREVLKTKMDSHKKGAHLVKSVFGGYVIE